MKKHKGSWLILLVIVYQFILIIGVSVGLAISGYTEAELHAFFGSLNFVALIQVTGLGLPALIYLLVTRPNLKQCLSLRSLSLKKLGLVTGISFCALPMGFLLSSFTSLFVNNNMGEMMVDTAFSYPLWAMLVVIGVLPSLFEEILFRGIVYRAYDYLPIHRGAMINGLLFGLIHLDIHQFFYAFAFGVLLTYLVFYTGSILAPILSHFILNGMNVLLVYLAVLFDDFSEEAYVVAEEPSALAIVIGAGIASLVVLPLFILLMKKLRALHDAQTEMVGISTS